MFRCVEMMQGKELSLERDVALWSVCGGLVCEWDALPSPALLGEEGT